MIDFAAFLASIRDGRRPYPWQQRLAERLVESGPPEAITVPTGTGKTTLVDALVWALAAQAGRRPQDRTVGVRTVWAIDRRLLVDEVHAQVADLAQRLERSLHRDDRSDPLLEVAKRLQSLKGEAPIGPPLLATRWRGAVPVAAPAQHPLQAEVVTSTVAQIGSRLLFRGYGLGDGSLPTGAALAACDTTICLDEAHLAEPFRQTVDAIRAHRSRESTSVAPQTRLVLLSATPTGRPADDVRLALSGDDRTVLQTRLTGVKAATLVMPDGDGERELLAAVERHLDRGATTVACVVNTVRLARTIHDRLGRVRPDVDRMLLFGPQRPLDRDKALQQAVGASGEGPSRREVLFGRAEPPRPLVVTATQAFEVGLDADVEALVTQSASAAALVQRFGRLNRAGDRQGTATVVRHVGFGLYEHDEPAAWSWLESLPPVAGAVDEVDVSVATLEDHPPPPPARIARAPALTSVTVELLTHTSPRPHAYADPDVEAFLRGTDADPASDVAICWRSDVDFGGASDEYRQALLRLVPPDPREQIALSLPAARNLLRGLAARGAGSAARLDDQVLGSGDVEGDAPAERFTEWGRLDALVLRGPEVEALQVPRGSDTLGLADLRPGDVVVLPTSTGGADDHGLAPRSTRTGDVAADLIPGDGPVQALRLTLGALTEALDESRARRLLRTIGRLEASAVDVVATVIEALPDHPAFERFDASQAELRRLTPQRLLELELDDDDDLHDGADVDDLADDTAALLGEEAEPTEAWVLLAGRRADSDVVRPASTSPPSLDDHARAVAARAGAFGRSAGLDERLRRTVELAARVHDHGKADPRMQAFFHGGVAPLLASPLAKSVFGTADRRAAIDAQAASGLPRGLRHELASTEVLRRAGAEGRLGEEDVDLELALHLVIAHHGRARPLPPVPSGGVPPRSFFAGAAGIEGSARGDGAEGWDGGASLRRLSRLTAEHGAWALVFLEALLVLADRTVSSEGG